MHKTVEVATKTWRVITVVGCLLCTAVYGQPTYTTPYTFSTIPLSGAAFDFPEGLAVDSKGNYFVADATDNTIYKVSPTGAVSIFAGGNPLSFTGVTFQNGQGTAATFSAPYGVAIDSADNVYVAELGFNDIRKITPSGLVTTLAGTPGSPTTPFNNPQCVAVDSNGNVYVGDNSQVSRVSPLGVVTGIAGSPASIRQRGYADGTGSAALFNQIRGLAVDKNGIIYVADCANSVIRRVTQSGVVTTIAGTGGKFGDIDGPGNVALFCTPSGIAVDSSGNLFVADSNAVATSTGIGSGIGYTLRKVTPSGVVSTLAGNPGVVLDADGIGMKAEFAGPWGILVDSQERLFVVDSEGGGIPGVSGFGSIRMGVPPQILGIQLVDPWVKGLGMTFPQQNGQLLTDPNTLSQGGTVVNGAAADGVTQLVLRIKCASTVNNVQTISLNPSDTTSGTVVLVAGGAVSDTPGGHMGLAIYTTPPFFDTGADANEPNRLITIQATLDDGTTVNTQIQLWRPPLLLVHGLWSSRLKAWGTSGLLTDSRFNLITYAADYESTNASSLLANVANYRTWIDAALDKERLMQIAATQVDVVAHSMGGLLTRLYIQNAQYYKRPDNYGSGDIHRLITFNTPHTGSPLASLLSTGAFQNTTVAYWFSVAGKNIVNGAIQDLSTGSSALKMLSATATPSHAIGGTGATNLTLASVTQATGGLSVLYVLINLFSHGSTNLLFGESNDGIVGITSELGGFPDVNSLFVDVYGDFNSMHLLCNADPVYAGRVDTLLTASDNSDFGVFPSYTSAAASTQSVPNVLQQKAITKPEAIALGLTLATGSTTTVPGGSVTLTVTPQPGVNPQQVLIVGYNQVVAISGQPFQASFAVPSDWTGPYQVQALATLADGTVTSSNILTLNVTPIANLTGIIMGQANILLVEVGQTEPLSVTQTYAGGSSFAATPGSAIIYASSNTSVATVDGNGLVTAIGNGSASISASEKGQTAVTSVVVSSSYEGAATPVLGQPFIAYEPGNQSVNPGAAVTLTVTATGTMPLAYQWFLNGTAISGATSSTYTIASAQLANGGSYTTVVSNAVGSMTSNPAILTVGISGSVPTFSVQPVSQTIAFGSTVVFSTTASGSPTYQWYLNSRPISGATSARLVVSGATSAGAGIYTCMATNSTGSTTSVAAALSFIATTNVGRLINLSVNTTAGKSQVLTVGFVSGGSGTTGSENLLIRATGPALAALGVPNTLADPTLSVFKGSAAVISNDNWGTPAANQTAVASADSATFAFPLTNPASLDAALATALPAAAYTAQVSGNTAASGTVLAEVYDNTPTINYTLATPRLINISAKNQVVAGGSMTAGFVVGGSASKTVLIRATGPALTLLGVPGAIPDPQIALHTTVNNQDKVLATNAGWGGDPQITAVSNSVFAFPLTNPASADSVLLVTLAPGDYTAVATSVSGAAGTVLIEVYEVP